MLIVSCEEPCLLGKVVAKQCIDLGSNGVFWAVIKVKSMLSVSIVNRERIVSGNFVDLSLN